jgi:hypothetical protein
MKRSREGRVPMKGVAASGIKATAAPEGQVPIKRSPIKLVRFGPCKHSFYFSIYFKILHFVQNFKYMIMLLININILTNLIISTSSVFCHKVVTRISDEFHFLTHFNRDRPIGIIHALLKEFDNN